MPRNPAGTASVISRTSQRRGGGVGRSLRPLIGYRSRLLLFTRRRQTAPSSFCSFITSGGSNTITSRRSLRNGSVTSSLTSGSWRKRRWWRSWRCPCQPTLSWTPGNCWGSSVPSPWGRRRLSPHSERNPADLEGGERHLWMEMRWYAEVGAHALTMNRASNSVLFPEYAKLGVFCFEVGVFPTVALLQMT